MKEQEQLEQLLLKSLDSTLSAQEQEQLDRALEASEELRTEREKLLAMRQLLATVKLSAKPSFADQLMQQLDRVQKPGFAASIIHLYPKVAAACILVLIASILGIYLTEGSLSVDALMGVQELSIDEAITLVNY